MATLILLLIFSIFLKTNSELVRLDIRNYDDLHKSVHICGILRTSSNKILKIPYQLDYSTETCTNLLQNSNDSLDFNSIYIKLTQNCSFSQIYSILKSKNSGLVLIEAQKIGSSLKDLKFEIPFVFLAPNLIQNVKNLFQVSNSSLNSVQLIAPAKFDYSILVVIGVAWLAVFTIALWNLYEFKKKLVKKLSSDVKNKKNQQLNEKNVSSTKKTGFFSNLKSYTIGYLTILIFVLILVGLVVLTYFFYRVMVWVLSVLFGFLATNGMYGLLSRFLDRVKFFTCRLIFNKRLPEVNFPILKNRPEIRKIILWIICIAVSVVWLINRRTNWSWILQDIMILSLINFTLSFNLFRSYQLVVVFLVLFFIYDTIMVLILPKYLQKINIMNSLAFGIKTSYESWLDDDKFKYMFDFSKKYKPNLIPFYLIFPNLSPEKKLCNFYYSNPYTILGIGDIIIPALSINYAIIYDKSCKTKIPVYFILNLVFYFLSYFIVGLIISFVNESIPPMLIINPILIIINLLLAFFKKDLKPFLNGSKIKEYSTNFGLDSNFHF